jgi:hypothetical protein
VEEGLNNFTLYLHSPKEETGFWNADIRETGAVDEVKVSVRDTDVHYRQKLTNTSEYVYVFL